MAKNRRGTLLFYALNSRVKPQERNENAFFSELPGRIRDGTVIPIVSNALISEYIFNLGDDSAPDLPPSPVTRRDAAGELPQPGTEAAAEAADSAEAEAPVETVENALARLWSKSISYPLPDKHDLAHVAQFNRVVSRDNRQAKEQYLAFLKQMLLDSAKVKGAPPARVEELHSGLSEYTFSYMVQELGYLEDENPLRVLARLPLPIYVTTSYHDFLERAILSEGRRPRTQVCFGSGEIPIVAPEHATDYNLIPTPENPLVYHLFGLERYPSTLVISEDDYLDFLVRVSQDTASSSPIIPLYLRGPLASSSLILLGFRLQDWDFRVLFRGIIHSRPNSQGWVNLIIQLSPEEQYERVDEDRVRAYLKDYFSPANFLVEWGTGEVILKRIWQEWRKWQ